MNKAKKFICGCLNADRKGIIYFGVDDQREILGLDIEDKKDEIISAFQDVLTDHIKSDSGKLNQGEQDCVKRHFIPVKSEGNRTGLYVMEIEVARDWKFCKDNVYYSKTWREKKDNKNNGPNLKALKDYFVSKPGEWDDAPVRNDGRTSSYPKEEVHEMVKIPLQKKLEEWQSSPNQGESIISYEYNSKPFHRYVAYQQSVVIKFWESLHLSGQKRQKRKFSLIVLIIQMILRHIIYVCFILIT